MTTVANSGIPLPKKKSLLSKLDVPIHHLEFDFVKKCTDVKELEKIIKILRSKEEGHYPELETCAENQLAALDSRNKLLRHPTKVMTKADLPKEEWNNINSDLLNWKGAVENNDLEVFETKSRSPNGKLPNIRNSAKGFRNTKTSESMTEKTKRISSLDYKSWENFDADEECKKMDLEEEQKQSVENRKNCPVSKIEKVSVSIEEVALESLGDISHLSANEREVMAVREKDIGNEFYNTNKVEDAIKHYTRSVHLCPTVAGLNNRAAAYLRQCSFNEALADLNQVLELDPKNVKARYRRAQSYQHKNMFREALDDINEVLMKEPTHLVARHIADQLRESVAKLPKMHRIKIKDKTTGKTMIKTITEKEMLSDYKNEDFIEVNDWGFPKIMCNCNGKHSNDPAIRHEDHMRYQHLNRQPQKKIAKVEPAKQETCAPIALPPKKLEILEVEKESQEAERMPGKKLEILEVEESSFQIESTNDSKSCVVADMRTTKSSVNPNPTKVERENTNSGQGSINDEAVEDKKPVCLDDQKTSLTNSKAVVNQRVTKRQRSTCSKTSHAVDPSKEQSPETTVDQMEKPGSEKPLKSGKSGKKTKDKKRHNSPKIENDKSLKTNANSIIKDTSSSMQSNRTTELLDVELLVPDRLKGVKTDWNARIQDNRLSKNGRIMQSCGCSEFFNEFKFKNDWLILKGPKSLEEKAKLLKSICPKHLIKAFGNSWEKEMLVDVILCLRNHFSPAEQLRAAEYLNIVPQLDRFKINSMFLTNDEKSLLRELVKNCSPHLDSSTVKAFS